MKSSPRNLPLFVATAVVLVEFFLLLAGVPHNVNWPLDFSTFYTAGDMVRHGLGQHLYDLAVQREFEHRFNNNFLAFLHPPYEAAVFAGLTIFSYANAFLVWDALNLILLGLAMYRLRGTGYRLTALRKVVWVALCALFVVANLMLGQDSLMLAAIFLLVFFALKEGRQYSAGLWLGVGLFRFEIVIPLAFIFLLRRRWKVLAGFLSAAAAAFCISLALVGRGGVEDYARLILLAGRAAGSRANNIDVSWMPCLHGLVITLFGRVAPGGVLLIITVLGSLILLGWASWQFKSLSRPDEPAFDLQFSFAAIASMLASYYVFIHTLTPLLVIGFLLLNNEVVQREAGVARRWQFTVLLSLFVAIFGIGWLIFHVQRFSVEAVILLGMTGCLAREVSVLTP
jgi:hypothetical protein